MSVDKFEKAAAEATARIKAKTHSNLFTRQQVNRRITRYRVAVVVLLAATGAAVTPAGQRQLNTVLAGHVQGYAQPPSTIKALSIQDTPQQSPQATVDALYLGDGLDQYQEKMIAVNVRATMTPAVPAKVWWWIAVTPQRMDTAPVGTYVKDTPDGESLWFIPAYVGSWTGGNGEYRTGTGDCSIRTNGSETGSQICGGDELFQVPESLVRATHFAIILGSPPNAAQKLHIYGVTNPGTTPSS